MHILKFGIACICFLTLSGLSWLVNGESHFPSAQPDIVDPTPLLKWEDYDRIAELITRLPAWTTDGAMEGEDWKKLAELASALQFLPSRDVEIALAVYMSKHAADLPKHMIDPDPRTRPLLLLAVMFDKASPIVSLTELRGIADKFEVHVCGGWPWQKTPEAAIEVNDDAELSPQEIAERLEFELFQWPLRWTTDGPKLLAVRVATPVAGTGPPRRPYQPHREFQAFTKMYPFRKNFQPLFEGQVGSWQLLWRKWIFDDADPETQKQLRYKYRLPY